MIKVFWKPEKENKSLQELSNDIIQDLWKDYYRYKSTSKHSQANKIEIEINRIKKEVLIRQ